VERRRRRWARRFGAGTLALLLVLAVVYAVLPKGPRDPMAFDSPKGESRPLATGSRDAVVAGTPAAAAVMREVLDAGGNAADAAVAGLLALNVTFGEAASFPGVAPMLYRDGTSGSISSYIGAGSAPNAATAATFRERGWDSVPDMDIWAQLLPASPDVALALLAEHGTMSFEQLVAPATALARDGFPVHEVMAYNLDFSLVERIGFQFLLPTNAREFTKGEWWRPIHVGDRFTRPLLADTFEQLVAAERAVLAAGGTRDEAILAVRDHIYEGPIAQAILDLHEDEGGLFTAEDLAGYAGGWETPLEGEFRGHRVVSNGTWSQGITVPLALQVLEASGRLDGLTWGSVEHVHTVLQTIDLVMADREAYVADSTTDGVIAELLGPEHAARRAAAIEAQVSDGPPTPGELGSTPVPQFEALAAPAVQAAGRHAPQPLLGKDTSHLAVVDSDGNAVTITPSDFPLTPMVPGTGLNLGNRMTQFRLEEGHPNELAPGKRPRITPHAVAVEDPEGGVLLLGTPGGDVQAQTNVQVLLNVLVFGMDLQEAVEAPRFRSLNFPSSFAPHEVEPRTIELEAELHDALADDLAELGYEVRRLERWDHELGGVGAVRLTDDGRVEAAADPHESTTALVR
jgi:gamma-glutamyltranspeptidase / glutathione hydrolase